MQRGPTSRVGHVRTCAPVKQPHCRLQLAPAYKLIKNRTVSILRAIDIGALAQCDGCELHVAAPQSGNEGSVGICATLQQQNEDVPMAGRGGEVNCIDIVIPRTGLRVDVGAAIEKELRKWQ